MANGNEAAIAALEAELGYGDAPLVPTTEEELAKEEARVAEDARTQAAVDKALADAPSALEQLLYVSKYGKKGREKAAEERRRSETNPLRRINEEYAAQAAEEAATEEAGRAPQVDPSTYLSGLDPEKLAKEKATEEDYLSGINRSIWVQGQIADKLGKIGDKQAALIGLEADYGAGFPETLADAKLRIQQKYRQDTQAYQDRFDTNMEEAELMAQYPGASMDQIRLWKRQMEFDPHRAGFSPEAAQDMLRRKATAMRNLARAEEIDPNRAFGGVTSQILAGLSVSLGAWASSKSGRPNTALDLYKHAITNDILAQKEKFSHARGAPARERSQYAFWMNRYDNERVATLGTAVAQYGAAANTIQKEIAQLKGGVQKDQALAIQGQLMSQRDRLKMELAKSVMAAEQAQNSGITGIDGKPIRYTGPADYDADARKTLRETGRRRAMANAALAQFSEAFKAASAVPGAKSRAALQAARDALIARLGDVWDKGVLQEFEWKQINDMLPGRHVTWAKWGINRVQSVLDELKKSFDGGFKAHIDALSFYQQSGTGEYKGKVAGTGERGTAEGSEMTPKQLQAFKRMQRKGTTTSADKLLLGTKSERASGG